MGSELFQAISTGNLIACHMLLSEGCDVNKTATLSDYNLSLTPLCQAVREENYDIVEMLIDAGADLEAENSFGSTALQMAIKKNSLPIVKLLIKSGCDVNIGGLVDDLCNFTPLHAACAQGNLEIVKVLLESGADPNQIEADQRQTAAFFTSSLPIYQLLIQHGLDVNKNARSGETALHHGIYSGC